MNEKVFYDSRKVEDLINGLAEDLDSYYKKPPILIGIKTGGIWIANRISQKLNWNEVINLDASYYRDDLWRHGIKKSSGVLSKPIFIEGKSVLLIDDILSTGRTIRAALNVLFDFGRPNEVNLAVLFDREKKRELPISPTFRGEIINESLKNHFKLRGPNPITLTSFEEKK